MATDERSQRIIDSVREPKEELPPIVGYEDMELVPLEIAVQPLTDLLPAVLNYTNVAKGRCINPADGLTVDESASIMLYSMSWTPLDQCLFNVLNTTLRSADRSKLQPWFLYLKLFFTALERLPSIHWMVYRGIKADMSKDCTRGASVIWWGFSSCTTRLDILESNYFFGKTETRTMFTIECKTGKNIRNHSSFPSEEEILIPAATQFRVLSCLDQGHGLHIIQLREITPISPLRPPALVTIPNSSSLKTKPQSEDDRESIVSTDGDSLLVWLDPNIDESHANYPNIIITLRQIVNTVYTFTDPNQCQNFLRYRKDKNIYVIISHAVDKNIVSTIHNMSQINASFSFGDSMSPDERVDKNWSRIKNIYVQMNSLSEAIKQYTEQLFTMSYIAADVVSSTQNLDQLDPSFMYTQILEEILLQIHFTDQHIKKFVGYCREIFANDNNQLKHCDKIEQEYHKHTPIWWYKRYGFLSSLLKIAIGKMDIDLIIKMGFFIQDLSRQIDQLHMAQLHRMKNLKTFTLYRRESLSEREFYHLIGTQGGLHLFNNFLLTTKNETALNATDENNLNNPDLIDVLYEIIINPSTSSTRFASISDVTLCQDSDDEVLLAMHSIFRVGEIRQVENNDRLYRVEITLTRDINHNFHALIERTREEIEGPTGWHRLAKFLLKLGHYKKAEEIYNTLISQTRDNRERSVLYDQLGVAKDGQEKYRQALEDYERSIETGGKTTSLNYADLGRAYCDRGLIYYKLKEYSAALSAHEKARELWQKTLPANHPYFAESYNAIGLIHEQMGQNDEALSSLQKAFEIRQKVLPPYHADLAESCSNLGALYEKTGEHSKAFSYYQQARDIGQHSLPFNHPRLQYWQKKLETLQKDSR